MMFIIYPAFFIVVNIFPLLHIIKGARDDKSITIWVLWFLGYYMVYNSLLHPIKLFLTGILGMKSLYYLTLTIGIGALTNPPRPMLTVAFTPLIRKATAAWGPVDEIRSHISKIGDILSLPVSQGVNYLLELVEKLPVWSEQVKPHFEKVMEFTDSDHRREDYASPRNGTAVPPTSKSD